VTEESIATTSLQNVEKADTDRPSRSAGAPYFVLAILGLSFWFFVGLPFASHRETYAWLAAVQRDSLAQQFAFGHSSTYRPLSQVATRLGFQILDPSVFPTNDFRQALLQGLVYGMFVLAWWLIYSAATHRRLFALVALVGGGVFFSGYVHLFHIYGMFYVPVILTLGALIYLHQRGAFENHEVAFAVVATALAFWHPFATGLFLGFYSGHYLDTFRKRTTARHLQAIVISVIVLVTLAALVAIFPRAQMASGNRLFGFLVSYQTNEVNRIASLVAFVLTQLVVFNIARSLKARVIGFLGVTVLSAILLSVNVPLLFLWLAAASIKLLGLRSWSLFFLMITAILLPFGGGIGTPIYGLFAIIVAIYVTSMGWTSAESALSFFRPQYAMGIIVALGVILVLIRAGINVPVVTRVAMPLLTERERTYQLENALAWLHTSEYCGYDISFTENSGSPVDSVDNVITRRNRPPAALEDVRYFWNNILRCRVPEQEGTTLVTFGGPPLGDSNPVFVVKGKYAGDAIVWIQQSQKH
jgi:hypothetical protein